MPLRLALPPSHSQLCSFLSGVLAADEREPVADQTQSKRGRRPKHAVRGETKQDRAGASHKGRSPLPLETYPRLYEAVAGFIQLHFPKWAPCWLAISISTSVQGRRGVNFTLRVQLNGSCSTWCPNIGGNHNSSHVEFTLSSASGLFELRCLDRTCQLAWAKLDPLVYKRRLPAGEFAHLRQLCGLAPLEPAKAKFEDRTEEQVREESRRQLEERAKQRAPIPGSEGLDWILAAFRFALLT